MKSICHKYFGVPEYLQKDVSDKMTSFTIDRYNRNLDNKNIIQQQK